MTINITKEKIKDIKEGIKIMICFWVLWGLVTTIILASIFYFFKFNPIAIFFYVLELLQWLFVSAFCSRYIVISLQEIKELKTYYSIEEG